jgi:hypothetical protein
MRSSFPVDELLHLVSILSGGPLSENEAKKRHLPTMELAMQSLWFSIAGSSNGASKPSITNYRTHFEMPHIHCPKSTIGRGSSKKEIWIASTI